MKLYLVWGFKYLYADGYEVNSLIGIYSSEEKAENIKKEYEKKDEFDNLSIDETMLDEEY